MEPQVGIREALGAVTFPEFILEQGEGCGRMLNLAIRIWVCFLDAPELVPKIPVNATLDIIRRDKGRGQGMSEAGWAEQPGPQRRPDYWSVPAQLEPPGAKGTTRTRLQMATWARDEYPTS